MWKRRYRNKKEDRNLNSCIRIREIIVKITFIKMRKRAFPRGPVVRALSFLCRGQGVRFPVRGLRSCKEQSKVKKIRKEKD